MRKKILGVPIDIVDFREAVSEIDGLIRSGRSHQVATVNSEFIMEAQNNEEFMKVLNSASLCTADGAGQYFALKFLHKIRLKERVTGADMFWALCKLAEDRGYRIFMLGAQPGVANEAARRVKIIHPRAQIVGIYPGSPKETKKIIEMINDARPNILFVAWGAPKQDIWIYENLKNFQSSLVAMGVGATFDFVAGKQVRAPEWMQSAGLEWMHRLVKEPKRMGRIFNAVIRFPLAVIKSKWFSKK